MLIWANVDDNGAPSLTVEDVETFLEAYDL